MNTLTDWTTAALAYLQQHGQRTGHVNFTGEDVRLAAEAGGALPAPSHKRAWGSVMVRAKRDGLIRRAGFAWTTDTRNSPTPVCLWAWVRSCA